MYHVPMPSTWTLPKNLGNIGFCWFEWNHTMYVFLCAFLHTYMYYIIYIYVKYIENWKLYYPIPTLDRENMWKCLGPRKLKVRGEPQILAQQSEIRPRCTRESTATEWRPHNLDVQAQFWHAFLGEYPPVNIQKTMENHHVYWVNPL